MNTAIQTVDAEDRRDVVATPMEMLAQAVSNGANPDTLSKLMDLAERYEAAQARRAFDAAMASAKAEIPTLLKNREVDFTTAKGRTNYRYEDLAEIANVVTPILAKNGLSYRYRTSSNIGEPVQVTCIVSHRDGYSEENSLTAPRDESGNKNTIQSVGSTITYLQRYTLKAALGLAVSNDDDGKKADTAVELVTEEQARTLNDLIKKTGTNIDAFLAHAGADSVDEIARVKYGHLLGQLQAKLDKAGGAS